MSSVVIAGNTSGSVTLDAPAVAGTTVLTLPAVSGTVVTTATTTGISGSAITTGTVGVSVGGTGANTLTANNVILGNGTSAVQFVAPGSNGNVLTSNGTTWTSAAASGGQLQTEVFTAPGTWTKPASATQVRVTVVAGGGAGGSASVPTAGKNGGGGGYAKASNVPVTGPVAITVGAAGNGPGGPGGTSSFGSAVSATGGTGGSAPTPGTPGAGTVSSGTNLRTYFVYASQAQYSFTDPFIVGENIPGPSGPTTGNAFSVSGIYGAGLGGQGGPVASIPGKGANGGAVIVEYVG